jgi:UBX domain-containing protein 1
LLCQWLPFVSFNFVSIQIYSGLAVEPTPGSNPDILAAIRSNAETGGAEDETSIRVVMYRMGFTIDDGPHRRLDDPENADFLRSLAQGRTPRELLQEGTGDVSVGLVDRRQFDYDEYMAANGGEGGAAASFTGEGQSLGGTTEAVEAGGVISPSNTTTPPEVDGSKPATTLMVRLLNGKRLRVKVNSDSPVSVVAQHVNASGDAGAEEYVFSSGFPPRVIEDLSISVKEAGLEGAQVMQKKV